MLMPLKVGGVVITAGCFLPWEAKISPGMEPMERSSMTTLEYFLE